MVTEQQFEQIMNRLDTLIKITAINAFQGKSIADVVKILSDLGFQNKDIAIILGTKAAYVANVRYELRKTRTKKEKVEKKTDRKEVEGNDE
jgi:hypothetical protein